MTQQDQAPLPVTPQGGKPPADRLLAVVRQEAIRGTFDPGYLYYTLGKLQILKLRQDYQREQGAGYSLQKFHDQLLRHGAPPIRLLREVMLSRKGSWDEVF